MIREKNPADEMIRKHLIKTRSQGHHQSRVVVFVSSSSSGNSWRGGGEGGPFERPARPDREGLMRRPPPFPPPTENFFSFRAKNSLCHVSLSRAGVLRGSRFCLGSSGAVSACPRFSAPWGKGRWRTVSHGRAHSGFFSRKEFCRNWPHGSPSWGSSVNVSAPRRAEHAALLGTRRVVLQREPARAGNLGSLRAADASRWLVGVGCLAEDSGIKSVFWSRARSNPGRKKRVAKVGRDCFRKSSSSHQRRSSPPGPHRSSALSTMRPMTPCNPEIIMNDHLSASLTCIGSTAFFFPRQSSAGLPAVLRSSVAEWSSSRPRAGRQKGRPHIGAWLMTMVAGSLWLFFFFSFLPCGEAKTRRPQGGSALAFSALRVFPHASRFLFILSCRCVLPERRQLVVSVE
jgi:hypothetical protein